MTTITSEDHNGNAERYLEKLQAELSVIPSDRRRDVYDDVSEHLLDLDEHSTGEQVLGAPADIARAALEDMESSSGKRVRPSFGMLAKRLQLAAAILFSVRFLFGFIAALFATDALGTAAGMALLNLIPIALFFGPLLFSGWRTWRRTSLLCIIGFAVYLSVSVAVSVTLTSVNFFFMGTFMVTPWPTFIVTGLLPLVLLLSALVVAPGVLQMKKSMDQ